MKEKIEMISKKLLLIGLFALTSSALITYLNKPQSYDDALVAIQSKKMLAPIDPAILDQPTDIQLLMMQYMSESPILAQESLIALKKYPKFAPDIFEAYGENADFKKALDQYESSIIPVIYYYRTNDMLSLKLKQGIQKGVDAAKKAVVSLWDTMTQKEAAPEQETQPLEKLDPHQRGLIAIKVINHDGYDFIGQFLTNKDGEVHWVQTDRITSGITGFLTSGIKNVEVKHDEKENVTASDYFFAATDALVFASALKVLKVAKAAEETGKATEVATQSGKALKEASTVAKSANEVKAVSFIERTRLFGASLIPKSKFLRKLGATGVYIATGYVIVTHPGLLNSIFAEIAKLLGLPAFVGQFLGWFLLIGVLFYPVIWLLGGFLSIINMLARLVFRLNKNLVTNGPGK
ncbi:hypothetical protein [Polynucleobacter sp. 35-46-11]|uniref:hypothetical protein n=1 Tax=Polynucleobacter sp. 35-46-11 TaxID=1970425 RepID=UPI0025E877E9|nr:hypothetical protein [Polynucleobacter sp. 35-46-11]